MQGTTSEGMTQPGDTTETDQNQVCPRRQTRQLGLDPQCKLPVTTHQQAKGHAQRCHDSSEVKHQRSKGGRWPNSWKSPPHSQNIVALILLLSHIQLLVTPCANY